MKVIISTPATSANLGAGFDALGLALSLRNEFCVRTSSIDRVHIEGCSAHAAALKKNNLFVNILREQLAALGADAAQRLDISMNNRIALSRGMGSSSSVIIAAIAAASALAGANLAPEQILARSLRYEPHTDNTAPCLHGGFCISQPPRAVVFGGGAAADGGAAAVGGGIAVAKFAAPAGLRAVVAVPKARMSTAASRAALSPTVPHAQASFNVAAAAQIAAAFASSRIELLRGCWGDFLHQNARMRANLRVYQDIFAALIAAGWLESAAVLQNFGEEFLPAAASAAAMKIPAPSENPLFSQISPHNGEANAEEISPIYFAALSGSGSSFLLLVRADASAQIAASLQGLSALEAVHDLALDNEGLRCKISD